MNILSGQRDLPNAESLLGILLSFEVTSEMFIGHRFSLPSLSRLALILER